MIAENEPQGPIRVSREVYEGLEAVRRSGATNMLDRPVVVQIAEALGFDESAQRVRADPGLYSRGIVVGSEAEGAAADGGL